MNFFFLFFFSFFNTERVGFEPTTSILMIDFQDQRFKPLSHLFFWSNRIRTYDHGTKNQCLTTWLYPKNFPYLNIIFKNTSTFKLIFHNIHTQTQI